MTDEPKDDKTDDVEWLKNAFERANQGDNGTVSETPRPAAAPFDAVPKRHDLDLDFETENTPPVTSFEPVKIPRDDVVENLATEVLDSLEIPESNTPTPPDPKNETSGLDRLDALFMGTQSPEPDVAPTTVIPPTTGGGSATDADPQASERLRQRLIVGAIGLGILLLAVGAFVAGRLVATPPPVPTPTPTANPAPVQAQPPGVWNYDELFGGECITPFEGPWSETFTVVDCETPHEAQLVYAGDLALDGKYPSYPGDDHVGGAAMTKCTRKGILDLGSAGAYSNLTMSVAYPASAAEWDAGDTRYFCFASRKGGDTVTGSIAGVALTRGGEATPEPTPTP